MVDTAGDACNAVTGNDDEAPQSSAGRALGEAAASAGGALADAGRFIGGVAGDVGQGGEQALDMARELGGTAVDLGRSAVAHDKDALEDASEARGETTKQAGKIGEAILDEARDAADTVGDGIRAGGEAAVKAVETVSDSVRDVLDEAGRKAGQAVEALGEAAKGVGNAVGEALDTAGRVGGRLFETAADVAKNSAKTVVEESRLQIGQIRQRALVEQTRFLTGTRARLSDLREKLAVASEVLTRIDIKAPRTGIVLNVKVATPGAVVTPGAVLAEVVPPMANLVLCARVSPLSIQSVAPGQKAEIRFPAFASRKSDPIFGQVESVSADAVQDPATRISY